MTAHHEDYTTGSDQSSLPGYLTHKNRGDYKPQTVLNASKGVWYDSEKDQ